MSAGLLMSVGLWMLVAFSVLSSIGLKELWWCTSGRFTFGGSGLVISRWFLTSGCQVTFHMFPAVLSISLRRDGAFF